MALELSIVIDRAAAVNTFGGARDLVAKAIPAAVNMAASMIQEQSLVDITAAGLKTAGLSVTTDDHSITTTYDAPGAQIFQTGGVIYGKPLLWIPISNTDAVGIPASEYPRGLFSVTRKNGGVPLLFSLADKAPRYFAVNSVNLKKRIHLLEIQQDVMAQFQSFFQKAMTGG